VDLLKLRSFGCSLELSGGRRHGYYLAYLSLQELLQNPCRDQTPIVPLRHRQMNNGLLGSSISAGFFYA
jgi:hypothetical protein